MANLSDKSTNVTNKTIADYFHESLPVHRELQEAQDKVRSITGQLRSIYKRAGNEGVSSKALARLLKERLADPVEVTKELHDYIRAKAVISPFPKEDVDMFAALLNPDVDSATKKAISLERVYDDGLFSGQAGHTPATNNPHPPGSEENATWHKGWLHGQKKIVDGMAAAPKRRGRPPKPKAGKLDPANEAPSSSDAATDEPPAPGEDAAEGEDAETEQDDI